MTANKYANKNKPAGILLIVYGAVMILIRLFATDVGGLLVFLLGSLGMIVFGVTLLTGRRDMIPVAGAGVLALAELIAQIIQLVEAYEISALALLMTILWLGAFVALVLVMAGSLLPQLERLRKPAKSLWFLPALLLGLNELINVIVLLVTVFQYNLRGAGSYIIGTLIGYAIATTMWLLSLIFSCQWAVLGEETKAALPQYQSYQQPQYQSYQQPQYQSYQQPQYQSYQQSQYQSYQQPQYQSYQQSQQYQDYQQPGQYQSYQPSAGGQDAAETLRRYKGLLDDGIISQEEYEAKKRQLLG